VLIPVLVVLKLLDAMVKTLVPNPRVDALNPERLKVPLVAVKFNAPEERVSPLFAVNNWVVVKYPVLVVVIPVFPKVIADVLLVPILIVPLV
jgi:hypothetical protein